MVLEEHHPVADAKYRIVHIETAIGSSDAGSADRAPVEQVQNTDGIGQGLDQAERARVPQNTGTLRLIPMANGPSMARSR
jgi:hypothetical protein